MIYKTIILQKKKKRKKRTKHLKRSDRLFNSPSQPIGRKKFVLFLNYGGTNHPEELYITGHGIHSDHCVNHCYQESPNKCTQDHHLQARQSKEPTQMHAGQSGRRSLVRFSPRVNLPIHSWVYASTASRGRLQFEVAVRDGFSHGGGYDCCCRYTTLHSVSRKEKHLPN